MGRAVKNFSHDQTRQFYTATLPGWEGVIWDGLQHRFDRVANPSNDYPTADGAQDAKCSADDQLSYHEGEIKMVKDGRDALGWGNVLLITGVLTVALIHDAARPGKEGKRETILTRARSFDWSSYVRDLPYQKWNLLYFLIAAIDRSRRRPLAPLWPKPPLKICLWLGKTLI